MTHRRRGSRTPRTALGGLTLGGLVLAGTIVLVPLGAGPGLAQPGPTTAPTLPTTVPTTAAPTVPTTAAPPTTERRTTTSAAPTTVPTTSTTLATTTTTLATTTKDNDPAWLPILLVLLAIGAIAAAIAAVMGSSKSRKAAATDFNAQLRGALVDVDMTLDLAARHAQTPDPRPFGQVITPRIHDLRSRLETVAAKAPDQQLGQQVSAIAAGVQSFGLATEAEWMLREGSATPTAAQLSEAGMASYDRRAAVEASVRAVRTQIGDPTAGPV